MLNEKLILLQALETITKEMTSQNTSLDLVQRYNNLVGCLIQLNWKEVGTRDGETHHINLKS